MRSHILVVLAFFAAQTCLGQEQKSLRLRKIDQPIRIDGIIDAAWSRADSVSDFVQFHPYNGRQPSRHTVARVLTTEEALYCLIVAYDDRENLQRNTGKLDDFTGDMVSIMLDTFGDRKTAYKFAVSASGVRGDSRMLDDARNRDYSWDGVWFAATKVYDWGYVVEMEIPYRSIRYDERLEAWGLDFDRWIPALREDIYWNRYEENEGQRISKFGSLVFESFRPSVKGMNLELYPVALSKATHLRGSQYGFSPTAGFDLFYNPSPQLTLQLTANPDFAQIEADPFTFNISRYESYFNERRPFFTEGNEIFMPSGRERGSGFYSPLELFYSRRIGKKLRDGSEVPLEIGARAFGRIEAWEYGGFVALTGETEYLLGAERMVEPRAYFASARLKRQILENSTIGVLYVGKHSAGFHSGVVDIDGAFRSSQWQLSYQLARSFKNSTGDFAASTGFMMFSEKSIIGFRGRYVGAEFDVNEVGFVPWRGTGELVALAGPRWYFAEGTVRQVLLYGGLALNYENVDAYTDRVGLVGFNMQFRNNWGYEINFQMGRSKDLDRLFSSHSVTLSSWFNTSPRWSGNVWGGYSRTYNFARNYLAFYSWTGASVSWNALTILTLGTSFNGFIEGNPTGTVEDITCNARPFLSLTPVNDLSVRLYVDNVFVRSTGRVERLLFGLLFSYNFSPKSWVYIAVNEHWAQAREYDGAGAITSSRMRLADRVGVLKIKYLYYF